MRKNRARDPCMRESVVNNALKAQATANPKKTTLAIGKEQNIHAR